MLDTVKVEDGKQALGQVELGLQKFGCCLVAIDVSIGCLLSILKDLFLKTVSEVEDNLIRICIYSKSEEVNLKLNTSLSQVLQGKPELSAHDEDLDSL